MSDEQGAIPGGMVRSQAFWDAAQECLRVDELTEFATGVTEEYRNGYKGACKIMSATLQRMSHQVFHELPLHTQIKAADRLTDTGDRNSVDKHLVPDKYGFVTAPIPEGVRFSHMVEQAQEDGTLQAVGKYPKPPVDAGAMRSVLEDVRYAIVTAREDKDVLAAVDQIDDAIRNLPDAGEPL